MTIVGSGDYRYEAVPSWPNMPRYWFAGDQFKTLLLTALSCTFPEGERFFVRSVRHYQKRITDPDLRERVKGFIGQEAHHGNEHEQFNAGEIIGVERLGGEHQMIHRGQ